MTTWERRERLHCAKRCRGAHAGCRRVVEHELMHELQCELDSEDGKGLAEGLAESTSLEELYVQSNNLKGSGGAFGEALKTMPSLKTLILTNCKLDSEDGKGLAEGLAACASLTSCEVWSNYDLGEEGEAALRQAVEGRAGFELEL